MPEHENGKKNILTSIFFFVSGDYVLNHHHAYNWIPVPIAAVFFKKAAIILATRGQKTLHWRLSKVMLSGIILRQ